jgi:hypothetical protein
MLRGFILGVVLTILAAAAAGYAILRTGTIPANADAKPDRFESWAAGTSLDATLARDAPKGPNPVPLTDANLIVGTTFTGSIVRSATALRKAMPRHRRSPRANIRRRRNSPQTGSRTIP